MTPNSTFCFVQTKKYCSQLNITSMYLIQFRTDQGRFQRWKTFGRFKREGSKGGGESELLLPLCLLCNTFLAPRKYEKKKKDRVLLEQYLCDICLYLLNKCIYKRYTLLDFSSLLSFRKESNQRRRIGAGVSIPPPLYTPTPKTTKGFPPLESSLVCAELY